MKFNSHLLLILSIFWISFQANAFVFVGLGVEGRYTKNIDDDYEFKAPALLYTGYGKLPWAVAVEALTYKESSGTSSLYDITVKHYEVTLYGLRFFNTTEVALIKPYVTAGVGLLKEKIETSLGATTQTDNSDTFFVGKAGLGLWSTIAEHYFFNLEGKALVSEGLDPKLMFNLVFRTGLEF